MKELILLRHAKSSWDYNVEDRNRPLSQKGIDRIIKTSKKDKKIFNDTDYIFSSPANRAIHTALIMAHETKIGFNRLNLDERLYTFNFEKIIDYVYELDDTLSKVVLVGHNPAFTLAANTLGNLSLNNISTACWVRINFIESSWAEVNKVKNFEKSKRIQ